VITIYPSLWLFHPAILLGSIVIIMVDWSRSSACQ